MAPVPVSAEPVRGSQGARVLPPHEILTIIRSTGLDPIGSPVRVGPTYVLRAVDRSGEDVQVVVDAATGRVRTIALVGPIGPYGAPPPRIARGPNSFHEPPPYYMRPRFRVLPPDFDDDEVAMSPPGLDPDDWRSRSRSAQPPLPRAPAERSAAVTPALPPSTFSTAAKPVGPPLPRPRPTIAAAVKPAPIPAAAKPATVPAAAPPPPAAPVAPQLAPKPATPAPEPLSKPSDPPVVGFE
jgi:hypothetical protein